MFSVYQGTAPAAGGPDPRRIRLFLTERSTGQGEDASVSVIMAVVLLERKRRRAGKERQTALCRTGEGWADRRSP